MKTIYRYIFGCCKKDAYDNSLAILKKTEHKFEGFIDHLISSKKRL